MNPTAPRFQAIGGDLYADRRPVSLEWAQTQIMRWRTERWRQEKLGNHRLAAEYKRQSEALEAAKLEVMRWHRASNPMTRAYESRIAQETLRAQLTASVEEGERA